MPPTKGKTISFGLKGVKNAQAGRYAGEQPPSGTYHCKLRRLGVRDNSKGNKMLVGIFEIVDDKFPQYGGYSFWVQQNVTNQGAGWVNDLLKGLTDGSEAQKKAIIDDFWDRGPFCVADDKGFLHIKKIGDFKVNSPNTEIECVVATKLKKSTQYGDKLEAVGYAPVAKTASGDDDEWEEDDDVEEAAVASSNGVAASSAPTNGSAPVEDEDDYEEEDDSDGAPF